MPMNWKRSIAATLISGFRLARWLAPRNESLYWLASDDPNYLLWLWRHKRPVLRQPPAPPAAPLFSVLMPVHDTPPAWLCEAVASVRRQTRGDWELLLIDDASTRADTRTCLAEQVGLDTRIRLLRNDDNRGIAASTNRGAAQARGDWLLLLDHDDILYPDALATFGQAIARAPDAQLFYADEDRITPAGLRSLHDFKPAFSPSRLEMCNYLLHPLCLHRELWIRHGGMRPAFDGSQDYELLLRLVDAGIRPCHVPGMLYSWRQSVHSMAGGANKPQIYRAGKAALAEHLNRRGEAFTAIENNPETGPGDYRIRFRLPTTLRLLLIDGPEALPLPESWRCDRAESDELPSAATLARYDAVLLLEPRLSCDDWPGALGELIAWCRRDDVGVTGGRVLNHRNRILHAGRSLAPGEPPRLRDDFQYRTLQRTPAASRLRDCLALAPVALAVAGPKLAQLINTDDEPATRTLNWYLRARERDWRVCYTPFADFRAATPLPDPIAQQAVLKRHGVARDPYLNPYLDSIRWNDQRLPLQQPLADRLAAWWLTGRTRNRSAGQVD